ncbi:Uncharacterized protein TCM_026496 [Theobroma cacao]|uniref:Uncharacterized protein n=1 Tax=Theobroma cacao TaxID=3641 RepID=A0A061F3L5_THECC|nr:Uncharacterized protein TCM_026496 [Theobroma cacao]
MTDKRMNCIDRVHFDSPVAVIRPPPHSDLSKQRHEALQRVDRELSKCNFRTALSLYPQTPSTPTQWPPRLQNRQTDLSNESNDCSYFYEDYRLLCLHDEAGHSPIGYLLGVLPKCYRTSSIEELHDDRFTAGSVDESLQASVRSISNRVTNSLFLQFLTSFA